jgi:cytidylate kinase
VHHVRVVAPRARRILRLLESGGSEDEVARTLDRVDRERLAFVRHRFGVDARDAGHYCLVVNTGCLSLESAADLLVGIAGSSPAHADGALGA